MKLTWGRAAIVLSLIVILTACSSGPNEGEIQTAIAQTAAAVADTETPFPPTATETNTPEPTATPEPTLTPSPEPTDTPTETPTSTPDLRVIAVESDKFLLQKGDLPSEARYLLPNSGWISPHHNSEIISGWGQAEGLAYLEETGRIDGWWVYYRRGTDTVRAPQEIYHNIIQYKTAEGAQLTVSKYNYADRSDNYDLMDVELNLGDFALAMIAKEIQPNGRTRVWIRIEMAYRNYASVVHGYGWEEDVELDYVIMVQELILNKLMDAPLVTNLP